jgi:hypothetical protein
LISLRKEQTQKGALETVHKWKQDLNPEFPVFFIDSIESSPLTDAEFQRFLTWSKTRPALSTANLIQLPLGIWKIDLERETRHVRTEDFGEWHHVGGLSTWLKGGKKYWRKTGEKRWYQDFEREKRIRFDGTIESYSDWVAKGGEHP